jgi:hypothetical protein
VALPPSVGLFPPVDPFFAPHPLPFAVSYPDIVPARAALVNNKSRHPSGELGTPETETASVG